MGLNQRYVSDYLTHLVGRGLDRGSQYSCLLKIIKSGWLTHPPHDPMISGGIGIHLGRTFSGNDLYCPNVVCFCDIPMADMALHIAKYSPFGLSFSKDFIAASGGSPVHYVAKSSRIRVQKSVEDMMRILEDASSHRVEIDSSPQAVSAPLDEDLERSQYFDRMIVQFYQMLGPFFSKLVQMPFDGSPFYRNSRYQELHHFLTEQFFAYVKFFDHRLPDDHPDNYYLEREWRIVGNLKFEVENIRRVLIPEEYAARFRMECPEYCGQVEFVRVP